MLALARNRIEAAACVAAREQAFADERGVVGVRTRLQDESSYTGHWDLAAVLEHLHRATDLQWCREDLTVRIAGDVTRQFALTSPGAVAHLDVVGTAEHDEVLRLAEQVGGHDGALWNIGVTGEGVAFGVQRPPAGESVCWEVDAPDGTVLYRVQSLELAAELYCCSPAGSHLLPVMAAPGHLPPSVDHAASTTAARAGGAR